jgi:hypothetical protein
MPQSLLKACEHRWLVTRFQLTLLGPIAGAQDAPPAFLVGKWVVSSVNTGDRLTDVTLAEDGKYQGGSWGAAFGGPNGLGATRYKYEGGILSFFYPHDNRRPDLMLEGTLRPSGAENRYDFNVTGGFYGTKGGVFRLQRISG